MLLQCLAFALSEERLDGFLTTMSERRIAHVMRITSRLDNRSNLFKERTTQLWMEFR